VRARSRLWTIAQNGLLPNTPTFWISISHRHNGRYRCIGKESEEGQGETRMNESRQQVARATKPKLRRKSLTAKKTWILCNMQAGKLYYTLFCTIEKIPGQEYQSKATEDDCEEWEEAKTKAQTDHHTSHPAHFEHFTVKPLAPASLCCILPVPTFTILDL
jgi:hypothetical protein